jgi:hypothetical protein
VREGRYLTASQAAGELGVSLATLYAYVSRGLIRSEAAERGGRSRRYRGEDVRKLKERKEQRRNPGKAVEGALYWGTPVMESAITLISDGKLYYRGRDVLELASRSSIEEVAASIWSSSPSQPLSTPATSPSARALPISPQSKRSRSFCHWPQPKISPLTTCVPPQSPGRALASCA